MKIADDGDTEEMSRPRETESTRRKKGQKKKNPEQFCANETKILTHS